MPEGKIWLAQDWTGDQIAAALYYMPKGVKPDVLSYWKPPIAAPAANDLMAVLSTGKNPVLAHTFLNFMLDETNAYNNFADYNGYQPPQNNLDFTTLQSKLGLPDSVAPAIMQRDDFKTGLTYQTLTPDGQGTLGQGLGRLPRRLTCTRRWIWRAFALPGIAWLVAFFLVAFYAIVATSFGYSDDVGDPIPVFNPLDWNVGWFNAVFDELTPGGIYWTVFIRTFVYVHPRGRPVAADRLSRSRTTWRAGRSTRACCCC